MRLAVFIVSLCVGQMLFKKAALSVGDANGVTLVTRLVFNSWFIVACCLYAFSTIVWITVLQRMPLSKAYPFVAAAFVLTPLGSVLIYGERLQPVYWLGTVFIMIGVCLASLAQ